MKISTFRLAAGLLFVAVAVLTLIKNTTIQALLHGSSSILIIFDLQEALGFILLGVSAFIAVPVLAAVGGALLGIVNIYYLVDEVRIGIVRNSFDVVNLLFYGLLSAACVFIIIFALKKRLVIGFLMPACWFLGNLISMVFGFAGKFFVVMVHTGDYLPLIIPLMTVLALLMYALSTRKE